MKCRGTELRNICNEGYLEWLHMEVLEEVIELIPSFIERNLDKEWDWNIIIRNPSITPEFFEKHSNYFETVKVPHVKFVNPGLISLFMNDDLSNLIWLRYNPSITLSFIEKNINEKWDWKHLSGSRMITPDFVEKYFNKPWAWDLLCCNPSMTVDFFSRHLNKVNWYSLSFNPSLTTEFIEEHLDMFDWKQLSSNPCLTSEFIQKYLKRLNIKKICSHPSLTKEIVEDNINKRWDYVKITMCSCIDPEVLMSYTNNPFAWLSSNHSVPLDFIEKYIDKPWKWNIVSHNPNITEEFVQKHLDKPWDWFHLNNIPLSPEFLSQHIQSWGVFSFNPLIFNK